MAKFRAGERVRIKDVKPNMLPEATGKEGTVLGRYTGDGSDLVYPLVEGYVYYEVNILGLGEVVCGELTLQKLLPDADTYHPATQSLDEILRSVRETEHV